ncbi:MAG: tRNA (adenosine(37)-N6)-dimethylallyltransferase MiaA [Candidatus Moranbacteria bacterium]|nr:tRNA (adenosine(37)-N6)-dimethylallyltransferase MiaA [Candidatus Moranbacteria bacterium]
MKSTGENILKKTLIIVGPTAGGKSDLAILLARKYNGEIISADSRQVYRGMNIGSGKVARDKVASHPELVEGSRNYKVSAIKNKIPQQARNDSFFYSDGIRHHLIDVASPKRNYNVTHFVRDAKKIIIDIKKREKIPIVCGGTGFWVQALIENNAFPAVKPDAKLREKLSKLSTERLFVMLQKKDPRRATDIDQHNKIRLIRALEICESLGTVPEQNSRFDIQDSNFLIIALNPNKKTLQKNIETRLEKRLKKGMVSEVRHLHMDGVSWKRLESFGLEYKNIALFLERKITRDMMQENLKHEIWHYAKRQLTWLRRFEKLGASIHWITDPKEAFEIIGQQD